MTPMFSTDCAALRCSPHCTQADLIVPFYVEYTSVEVLPAESRGIIAAHRVGTSQVSGSASSPSSVVGKEHYSKKCDTQSQTNNAEQSLSTRKPLSFQVGHANGLNVGPCRTHAYPPLIASVHGPACPRQRAIHKCTHGPRRIYPRTVFPPNELHVMSASASSTQAGGTLVTLPNSPRARILLRMVFHIGIGSYTYDPELPYS